MVWHSENTLQYDCQQACNEQCSRIAIVWDLLSIVMAVVNGRRQPNIILCAHYVLNFGHHSSCLYSSGFWFTANIRLCGECTRASAHHYIVSLLMCSSICFRAIYVTVLMLHWGQTHSQYYLICIAWNTRAMLRARRCVVRKWYLLVVDFKCNIHADMLFGGVAPMLVHMKKISNVRNDKHTCRRISIVHSQSIFAIFELPPSPLSRPSLSVTWCYSGSWWGWNINQIVFRVYSNSTLLLRVQETKQFAQNTVCCAPLLRHNQIVVVFRNGATLCVFVYEYSMLGNWHLHYSALWVTLFLTPSALVGYKFIQIFRLLWKRSHETYPSENCRYTLNAK